MGSHAAGGERKGGFRRGATSFKGANEARCSISLYSSGIASGTADAVGFKTIRAVAAVAYESTWRSRKSHKFSSTRNIGGNTPSTTSLTDTMTWPSKIEGYNNDLEILSTPQRNLMCLYAPVTQITRSDCYFRGVLAELARLFFGCLSSCRPKGRRIERSRKMTGPPCSRRGNPHMIEACPVWEGMGPSPRRT